MLLCLGRKVVRLEGRRVNRQIVWYYDTTVCQVLDHWVCQITLQLTLSTLSALKIAGIRGSEFYHVSHD